MLKFEEIIDVEQECKKSFSFLSNFSNLPDWDFGIESVEKVTEGILRVGTKFVVQANFMGRSIPMTYTLEEYILDKKVVYRGESENLIVVDTIEFEESGMGTKVLYGAEFDFQGILKNIEPVFKVLLKFTAQTAFTGMKKALSKPTAIVENKMNAHLYKLFLPVIFDFSKIGYNSVKKNFRALTEDLSNKTAVVTGASTGIGFETAMCLAKNGASVILVSKNLDRLKIAKEKIQHETGNTKIYMEACDLSLLEEAKKLAEKIKSSYSVLDILVNNAGALFNERTVTDEGYEKSAALLLYSPYVLTEKLLPLLEKSKSPRIINVSSGGMYTQKVEISDPENEKDYNGAVAYARAKRGLVILSDHWAKSLQAKGIHSYSMHPGWADTDAVRESLPMFYEFTKLILRSPRQAADTVFWLSAAEEVGQITGGFWFDREKQPQHILNTTENSEEELQVFINSLKKLL
jgi:dehydrogenase/reductase SDR family protein 12